jgi:hypothetical protein
MLASAPHGSPASNSAAGLVAHQVRRLDLDVGAAIGNCTPWFWPMGRSNTTRSFAYFAALSTNQ